MLGFLTILVSSVSIVDREVLTEAGEWETFLVRYTVYNAYNFTIDNVVVSDPSFTRKLVKIKEKTRARITYGSIDPGFRYHVDLEVIPK